MGIWGLEGEGEGLGWLGSMVEDGGERGGGVVFLYRLALQANKSDAGGGEWRRTMLEETNEGRGN